MNTIKNPQDFYLTKCYLNGDPKYHNKNFDCWVDKSNPSWNGFSNVYFTKEQRAKVLDYFKKDEEALEELQERKNVIFYTPTIKRPLWYYGGGFTFQEEVLE
mgnify:FL=1|tara:strand:- start:120 stop:425 length:306 start_codon:yes stop_codon:yes gene_type:complete